MISTDLVVRDNQGQADMGRVKDFQADVVLVKVNQADMVTAVGMAVIPKDRSMAMVGPVMKGDVMRSMAMVGPVMKGDVVRSMALVVVGMVRAEDMGHRDRVHRDRVVVVVVVGEEDISPIN